MARIKVSVFVLIQNTTQNQPMFVKLIWLDIVIILERTHSLK